jgi:hypothetical protein
MAKNGKPFLFFSCGQGRYYHHEKDTLEWINFFKLSKLVDFIHEVLERLDATPAGHQGDSPDPVDFEIRMIGRALGETRLESIMTAVGWPMPKTRQDLDQLIGALLGQLK